MVKWADRQMDKRMDGWMDVDRKNISNILVKSTSLRTLLYICSLLMHYSGNVFHFSTEI